MFMLDKMCLQLCIGSLTTDSKIVSCSSKACKGSGEKGRTVDGTVGENVGHVVLYTLWRFKVFEHNETNPISTRPLNLALKTI